MGGTGQPADQANQWKEHTTYGHSTFSIAENVELRKVP